MLPEQKLVANVNSVDGHLNIIPAMARRRKPETPSFYESRAEYRAARQSRFGQKIHGVAWEGSNADYHYRSEHDWLCMLETARHHFRNDLVLGQGIRRLVSNVLQGGFSPDPETGSADLDNRFKELWYDWANEPDKCHNEGRLNFHQLETLALQTVIVDGDTFILPLNNGTIQGVEAHRVRTPRNTRRNVVHGVLLSNAGKELQYWITKEEFSLDRRVDRVSDVHRYQVRNRDGVRQILHLSMPDRMSQHRGISAIAPISELVGQVDDLQYTSLVKAQMASSIAIIRERSANGSNLPGVGLSDVKAMDGQYLDDEGCCYNPIPGLLAGLEVTGQPGETIKGFAPQLQTTDHKTHSELLLTFVAVNLDLPLAVLLLDPSNTNFSSWRGAIDQSRIRFRAFQQFLKSKFHKPIYEWKVRQWLESDLLAQQMAARSGVDPYRHKWSIPGYAYIKPMEDAQADDLQVKRFLNSLRRVHGQRGREWDEMCREIPQDFGKLVRAAIEEATEINAQYPDAQIDWRELLSIGGDFSAVAQGNETEEMIQ